MKVTKMNNNNENNINSLNLLSAADVARILGVKEHTLACWRSTKKYQLKWIKIGRTPKYRLVDLEAFINTQTVH